MFLKEYLKAVCWWDGAGLRPADVDLVEVGPLKDICGNRLANECEVLQDHGGRAALLAFSSTKVECVDGEMAEGDIDF